MRPVRTLSARLVAALAALALVSCGGSSGPKTTTPVDDGPEVTATTPPKDKGPAPEPPPPELTFPEEPFRAKPPEPGTVKAAKAPPIQRFRLKNGIDVYLVEDHKLPTIAAELTFDGGAIDDPAGKEGLASLCMDLLDEGTTKLDKIAFEEALADLASHVGSYAGTEEQGVTMQTLAKNLDATIELWADTLLAPGLRQAEFDRLVKRRIVGIGQQKRNPAGVSQRVLRSVAWGPSHPYGKVVTEASTKAITLGDCQKYVATRLKPAGARLFVVGDITRADLEAKLGARLGGWKGKPKKATRPGKPKLRKGRIFLVDAPAAPQTVVSLVHPGPARTAKDYFPTAFMSAVLGGGFSSRINMNIRERNGFAYGARGGFDYARAGSTFVASASVKADKTVPAIVEMVKEIRGMKTGGATGEELGREKEGAILSLPARWATGGSTIEAYQDLVFYGLPLDYYDKYATNVQAVVVDQVKQAAARWLQPEALQIVVVGDARSLRPELEALLAKGDVGTGELVVLDPDGKVVTGAAAAGGGAGDAKAAGAEAPKGSGASAPAEGGKGPTKEAPKGPTKEAPKGPTKEEPGKAGGAGPTKVP